MAQRLANATQARDGAQRSEQAARKALQKASPQAIAALDAAAKKVFDQSAWLLAKAFAKSSSNSPFAMLLLAGLSHLWPWSKFRAAPTIAAWGALGALLHYQGDQIAIVAYGTCMALSMACEGFEGAAPERRARKMLKSMAPCVASFGSETKTWSVEATAMAFPGSSASAPASELRIKIPPPYEAELAHAIVLAFCESRLSSQPSAALILRPNGTFFARTWPGIDDWVRPALEQALAAKAPLLQKMLKPIDPSLGKAWAWKKAFSELATRERQLASARTFEADWQAVALPPEVLDAILKPMDMFASKAALAPKGILLYGPPGTGKTALARNLKKTSGCSLIEAGAAELKGAHLGSTAPKVKDIWAKARSSAPCILFIDECEGVFGRRGGANADAFGEELVQAFLSEWDGLSTEPGQVMVIGSTNRRELIDEALMSRFTRSVHIPMPNQEMRVRILRAEFSKGDIPFPEDAAQIGRETSGMSGRDLHQLAAIVASEAHGAQASPELILREIAKMRSKTSTDTAALTWEDLVLPEEVKKQFLTLGKELKNAELLASLNIRTPSGALLYGPPGTGKTQLARVLARESGLAFISASTSDIKKGYLGQSGQAVRELFERARAQSPCILFIDEFETVAGSRSGSSSNAIDSEIVGELLQAMDGAKAALGRVFVMAATNHPDLVDSAILSRLERKFELPLPDDQARHAIALSLLRGKPLAFEPEEGAALAARLANGRSGRDLRSLIESAAMSAVRRELSESDVIGELMRIQLSDIENAAGSMGAISD